MCLTRELDYLGRTIFYGQLNVAFFTLVLSFVVTQCNGMALKTSTHGRQTHPPPDRNGVFDEDKVKVYVYVHNVTLPK